jgi:excinuclease ABC subunit C
VRERVRSYFSKDLVSARSSAIAAMVESADAITWQTADSVLEALILEANLIKKHQPRFNTDEKDNKSWNYLVLTRESFPRVLVVRGRELFDPTLKKDYIVKHLFGPYPQGGSLKEAVKIVRKIFPFRDSCTPGTGKPCFNAQIGLCPGVCAGAVDAKQYASLLRNVTDVFAGKMPSLRKRLEREMKTAARAEDFERATVLRRQVHALAHIRDVSLIKDEHRITTGGEMRIEAYDVAHTAGKETVGVMTVVSNGEAEKAAYRKFTIRTAGNDDPKSLAEMLERRLAHREWPLPRLIVVDGMLLQCNLPK